MNIIEIQPGVPQLNTVASYKKSYSKLKSNLGELLRLIDKAQRRADPAPPHDLLLIYVLEQEYLCNILTSPFTAPRSAMPSFSLLRFFLFTNYLSKAGLLLFF